MSAMTANVTHAIVCGGNFSHDGESYITARYVVREGAGGWGR